MVNSEYGLTSYGTIEEVWLDGGKEKDAKLLEFYFNEWRNLIHEQLRALISRMLGPMPNGSETSMGWQIPVTGQCLIALTSPLAT